jgi:hypothetical protein
MAAGVTTYWRLYDPSQGTSLRCGRRLINRCRRSDAQCTGVEAAGGRLQGGSAGHREPWSQHNFDGYGAKLGNACPPDGSLTGHPRPEISLFNCTESVPWARGSCNSFQSSTMIYRGGSFGRALARAPTSRAETSFCRSPVVKLLLIIQVPDASDKRGVGLLFHPINRFSLRFEGAERIVHVVLHKQGTAR